MKYIPFLLFSILLIISQSSKAQKKVNATNFVQAATYVAKSTAEVIELVNQLIKQNVRVIFTKQNLDITGHDMSSKIIVTMFSLFAEFHSSDMKMLPLSRHFVYHKMKMMTVT